MAYKTSADQVQRAGPAAEAVAFCRYAPHPAAAATTDPTFTRRTMPFFPPLKFIAGFLLFGLITAANTVQAQDPWRLGNEAWVPERLSLSGSYRLRFEWLDNAFRAGAAGSDDLLVSRLLLAAELRASDRLRFGVELQDSRAWGGDPGTPLGTDDINALEPLQAYVGLRLPGLFRSEDTLDVRLGRFTMAMGGNRFVARHAYRNTLQGFTGVNAIWDRSNGPRLQLFATRPVTRLPSDRNSLADNDIRTDEDSNTTFWGAHLDRLQIGGAAGAVYLFGIDDSDSQREPTRNRNFLTAGLRLVSNSPEWHWEIEPALQIGSTRDSAAANDRRNLDHSAWLLHAELGRRFPGPWNPDVEVRLDVATGDDRPGDGDSERFDSLFGPPRFDFGPTGIYNAARRTNVITPAVYAELTPRDNMRWMIGYRAIWLASDTDAFAASGLRDPSGQSGSFVGQQLETRWRWELEPGGFRFEAGAAYLVKERFLRRAPGAPPDGNTIYLYSNLLLTF